MIFNGFCCRCQCRCRPDVRGFVTLISFSAPMDDILSNEQWKDSLQFLQIVPIVSTKIQLEHELPPNHKQLPGVQSTKVVHILVQIEQRQQLLKFQNSELFICMRWHQIVRLFLAICQEPVHSESEAMPKHLLARSTWFRKVSQNNSFFWSKIRSSSLCNISHYN